MFITVRLGTKRPKSKTGTECDGTCRYEFSLKTASCCLQTYGGGGGDSDRDDTGTRQQGARTTRNCRTFTPYERAPIRPDHAA